MVSKRSFGWGSSRGDVTISVIKSRGTTLSDPRFPKCSVGIAAPWSNLSRAATFNTVDQEGMWARYALPART